MQQNGTLWDEAYSLITVVFLTQKSSPYFLTQQSSRYIIYCLQGDVFIWIFFLLSYDVIHFLNLFLFTCFFFLFFFVDHCLISFFSFYFVIFCHLGFSFFSRNNCIHFYTYFLNPSLLLILLLLLRFRRRLLTQSIFTSYTIVSHLFSNLFHSLFFLPVHLNRLHTVFLLLLFDLFSSLFIFLSCFTLILSSYSHEFLPCFLSPIIL